jgi:hypothetical protein
VSKGEPQLDVVQKIIEASRQGREIVCLIGAGLSVESGIPPLGKLTQYLAKVQGYISRAAFRPPGTAGSEPQLPPFGEKYRSDPSGYIREIGWPDPNQLNADLWSWIDQVYSGRPGVERKSYLEYHVRSELIEDLLRFDADLAKSLDGPAEKERNARLAYEDEEWQPLFGTDEWKQSWKSKGFWHAGGNWKTLMTHLTGANPDYADALFQSLVRNRKPGMAHRFLAFLTPLLGLRLFLTLNFDDLLEEALRYEGLHPAVYAVSRDSPLPHQSLVRSQLSVVKLHGDGFRLRLGEDLNFPLDEESKARLEGYLPERPLLLVLGLGANDRRVMDFVEIVAKKYDKKSRFATVYWMYFESTCPKPVTDLEARYKGAIYPLRTQGPASLLLEMLSRLAGSHPPSLRPYDPKMGRPIVARGPWKVKSQEKSEEESIHLFLDDKRKFDFGASLDLSRFVAEKTRTHVPIWIDLEAMHTYEEVAVEIIRQIHRYDRSIPPMVLPGGPAPNDVEKAVRRIRDALVRDRYVIAFNGVTRFGRPPTWHHGREGMAANRELPGEEEREQGRIRFLYGLIDDARMGRLRESVLALSLSWKDLDKDLRSALEPWSLKKRETSGAEHPWRDRKWAKRHHEAFMLLAAFRRRRSYVALLQLLPEYLPNGRAQHETKQERVDSFLKRAAELEYVVSVAGGEYWMCRHERDKIYQAGKKQTTSGDLIRLVKSGLPPEENLALVQRLALLVRIHRDIARYCYSDLFAASQDPSALLEHLYHQIASLRFLTKLDAWLLLTWNGEPPEEVCEALDRLAIGRPTRRALRQQRLLGILALNRVLDREREVLLSNVFSDPLIGWVDWMLYSDIGRLKVANCLGSSEDDEIGTRLQTRLDEDALKQMERDIVDECAELSSTFQNFKADALRDKMDFAGCQRLRRQQIAELIGRKVSDESFATLWSQGIEPFLASVEARTDGSCSYDVRRLIRYQCDVWLCLRGQGPDGNEEDSPETLRQNTRNVIHRSQEMVSGQIRKKDLDAMTIRWYRGDADHTQLGLSPWSLRGVAGPEADDAVKRCEETIRICDQALGTLEWAVGQEYARHRSYFQSLKGRACYVEASVLRGKKDSTRRQELFAAAHHALDRAQAGVAPTVGANREALAIALLRLAECLMIRANEALDDATSRTRSEETVAWALSSAERRLDRASNVLVRAEEMLTGARQNMEWWACLYQLKAQIEVESLLWRLSGSARPEEMVRPQLLQPGLHAIRQGLDVLLPVSQDGQERRSHIRIDRFLRMWVELMVCGAALSSVELTRSNMKFEMPTLWSRWSSLNRTAGLERLAQPDFLGCFTSFGGDLPTTFGLEARRTVLNLIDKILKGSPVLGRLWIELRT